MTLGADLFELDIPAVPMSLNKMGASRGASMRYYRKKKELENLIIQCLWERSVPKGLARIHATAVCRFKTRHKRDEGNFRWLLEKALGDALQINRNLTDDTVDEFTFGSLTIDPEPGNPRSLVTLEVWR